LTYAEYDDKVTKLEPGAPRAGPEKEALKFVMAREELKSLIKHSFSPSVLILSTEGAENVSRRSDMSLLDLFRPFSLVDTSSVAVNSTREQPFRIPQLSLRFCESSEVEQPSEEFVDVSLDAVMRSYETLAQNMATVVSNKEDALLYLQQTSERQRTPWYDDYRTEMLRGLRCGDHEYFDHPLACLIVVSSSEEDPVPKLVSLLALEALPPLFRDGMMDPNMLKHYVLLHDNTLSSSQTSPETTFQVMRETFGPTACSLLRVNSNGTGDSSHSDLWNNRNANFRARKCEPSVLKGKYMSAQDVDNVSRFVTDFVVGNLLPHMDKRIRSLNQQVVSTRKGFKNQFKSWGSSLFGRAGPGEVGREGFVEGSDASGPIYLYTSIEAQIRALADLAFMLQDYDLALSHYKLVQADFKKDKAWKHLGGAMEMAALCLFMLHPDSKKQMQDELLDNAYLNYQRFNLMRLCTRVAFLHADVLKYRGKWIEAAEKLIRCTSSESADLRAALLYEQAAMCFLQVVGRPHMRKYALHLVHAGHRYLKSSHKVHGVRCYEAALQVYRGKEWTHIDDHLLSALGKHCIGLDAIDAAVDYYVMLLLNQENKGPERQLAYLREFVQMIRQLCPNREVSNAGLPRVADESLSVRVWEPDEAALCALERAVMPWDHAGVAGNSLGGGASSNDADTRNESELRWPWSWLEMQEALVCAACTLKICTGHRVKILNTSAFHL
jgi:trafficking protein particle complex subunit 8